jgi:chromosome condensin MukBEF MukE localization factor
MNLVELERDLAKVFNYHGIDTQLDTPDYLLAQYVSRHIIKLKELLDGRELHNGNLEHKVKVAQQSLDRIEVLLFNNQKSQATIMADLTQITADVQATTDVEQSAIVLIGGLKTALDAAGTDPVKLAALSKSLEDGKDSLAAAVAANTVADPNASEGTDGSGTGG